MTNSNKRFDHDVGSVSSGPCRGPSILDVALRRAAADVVIRGGQVVHTLTGELESVDIAIADGMIAFVGNCDDVISSSTTVFDVDGRYVMPGFIDGHLHPENSRLSPAATADLLVSAGTTSIVTGLDHIAAASGISAVRSALDTFAASDLNVFWASPFRLPYTTPASTLAHTWGEQEHRAAMDWPECIGVWELCPGFIEIGDAVTLAGITEAHRRNLGVYGSVPAAENDTATIAAHVAAGLRVDHEAYSATELRMKLRMGLFALVRDSTLENFLGRLIEVVVDDPSVSHLVGFCTDGFQPEEVAEHGHVSRLVRDAITHGVPPLTAIQMATINTARAYRVDHLVGSICPGRRADLLICDDLDAPRPQTVFSAGRLVVKDGYRVVPPTVQAAPPTTIPFERSAVNVTELEQIVSLPDGPADAVVIELTDNPFDRLKRSLRVEISNHQVELPYGEDVCYLAYVNRHSLGKLTPGLGLVRGFGIRAGAIATSSTPDDENILCAGTSAADMALAINEVIGIGGGDVVVSRGKVLARFDLPVHGIMSNLPADEVVARLADVQAAARSIGCTKPHPMNFLGLLAITGIPEIGMSENGPVDTELHQVIPLITSVKKVPQ